MSYRSTFGDDMRRISLLITLPFGRAGRERMTGLECREITSSDSLLSTSHYWRLFAKCYKIIMNAVLLFISVLQAYCTQKLDAQIFCGLRLVL